VTETIYSSNFAESNTQLQVGLPRLINGFSLHKNVIALYKCSSKNT